MNRLSRLGAILPTVELLFALAAAGLWYSTGGAVWYRAGSVGPWPLVLLLGLWLIRWVTVGLELRPSVFAAPLALLVVSAAIGVWAAYDPGPAWAKFWLLLGALGLYWALSHQPALPHLYVALAVLGLLAAGLALYFLASNPWGAHPVKISLLTRVGRRIAGLLPDLEGHRLSPNVAGGLIAVLLPCYVPLLALTWDRAVLRIGAWRKRALLTLLWLFGAALAGLGLLLSVSRGAWVALAATAGLWALWRFLGWCTDRTDEPADRAWRRRVIAMASLVLLGAAFLALLAYLLLLAGLPGAGALRNRLSLLRDGLLLARDYWLTGAGLGTFEMQFSIYTLLIHVGYIVYSHNMFVDLLIEQGVLGLLSYLWLVGAGLFLALRAHRHASASVACILEAGLASLGVGLIHGLVDDIQYGSRGLLLIGVPFGLLLAASRLARPERPPQPEGVPLSTWPRWTLAGALVPILVAGVCWRPLVATLYANLGAVEQSRVELTVYDQKRFNEQPMDVVRQTQNLDRAIALFERAIQLDPAQVTARQRLAAIALSRGAYREALRHMEILWAAGQGDSITRLLLGDALVAVGEPERAAETIRGLTWAKSRLLGQAWGYFAGEQWQRAYDAWSVVLTLYPEEQNAKHWIDEAQKRLGRQ